MKNNHTKDNCPYCPYCDINLPLEEDVGRKIFEWHIHGHAEETTELSEYPTFYDTIVASKEWQLWEKVAHGEGIDWHESTECGWLSPEHFSAFLECLEWVKSLPEGERCSICFTPRKNNHTKDEHSDVEGIVEELYKTLIDDDKVVVGHLSGGEKSPVFVSHEGMNERRFKNSLRSALTRFQEQHTKDEHSDVERIMAVRKFFEVNKKTSGWNKQ